MLRADNLATFTCRLSWNLWTSTSWNTQGLSRPVMGLLYLFVLFRRPSVTSSYVVQWRLWSVWLKLGEEGEVHNGKWQFHLALQRIQTQNSSTSILCEILRCQVKKEHISLCHRNIKRSDLEFNPMTLALLSSLSVLRKDLVLTFNNESS